MVCNYYTELTCNLCVVIYLVCLFVCLSRHINHSQFTLLDVVRFGRVHFRISNICLFACIAYTCLKRQSVPNTQCHRKPHRSQQHRQSQAVNRQPMGIMAAHMDRPHYHPLCNTMAAVVRCENHPRAKTTIRYATKTASQRKTRYKRVTTSPMPKQLTSKNIGTIVVRTIKKSVTTSPLRFFPLLMIMEKSMFKSLCLLVSYSIFCSFVLAFISLFFLPLLLVLLLFWREEGFTTIYDLCSTHLSMYFIIFRFSFQSIASSIAVFDFLPVHSFFFADAIRQMHFYWCFQDIYSVSKF